MQGMKHPTRAQLQAACEAARHELTTLHGLHAHDGNPAATWQIDTSAALAQLDAVLPTIPAAPASPPRQMVRHPERTL
jgi:hypothetical protein